MTTARFIVFATALSCGACSSGPPDAGNHDVAHAIVLQSNVPRTGRANENLPDFFVADVAAGAVIHLRASPLVAGGEPGNVVVSVTDPSGTLLFATAEAACPSCDAPRVNHCENYSYTPTSGYQVDCPAATAGRFVIEIVQHDAGDNLFPFHWDYTLSLGF